MEKFFKLQENGTDIKTELMAGVTTFLTMAYIIFLAPSVLAQTGMDLGAVFVATIIAATIGTFFMGFIANVPFAQAPGVGLNAFFVFTVVFGLGFTWQQALAMVFLCGIINILITITKVRKMIVLAIPESLQYAISGGIGLFIAYIGIKQAHFLQFTGEEANRVLALGEGGVFSDVIPALVNFSDPISQVAIIGLLLTLVLMLLKVKSSILLGILITTIVGIFFNVTQLPTFAEVSFAIPSIEPTLLKLDFAGLFANPDRIPLVIATVFAFSLTDIFDTIGTFLGAGKQSGIFDQKDEENLSQGKGLSSKFEKAFFADATATSVGALLGTSNITTFVESSAGISQGGRTGLTSVVTGSLFLLCLFISPLVGIVPGAATAPALIVVGVLMSESLSKIKWSNLEIAIPAFFTLVVMPFTYSITNGVAAGFILYCIAMLVKKKAKEVHPIMYIVTALFILSYVIS